MIHPLEFEIVGAIRSHSKIGRLTCSPIDECYSDEELVKEFGFTSTGKPRTVVGAVRAAVSAHNLWVERYEDIAGTAF